MQKSSALLACKLFLAFSCTWTHSASALINTNAGGISFMQSDNLAIEREDITLSLDQVSVAYVFKNKSPVDLLETIVFAVPMNEQGHSAVHQYQVEVNGRKMAYQTKNRAMMPNGVDVTQLLAQYRLPIDSQKALKMIQTLDHNAQQALYKLGLVAPETGQPRWENRRYYFWRQHFASGKPVHIYQTYIPAVTTSQAQLTKKSTVVERTKGKLLDLIKPFRSSDKNLAEYEPLPEYEIHTKYGSHLEQFCNNQVSYQQLINSLRDSDYDNRKLMVREIKYQLTQDASWSGPIRHFTLKIEHPSHMQPVICWPLNFVRHSRNTLISKAENFIPLQDIQVLLFEEH